MSATLTSARASVYLHSPALDLLVGCGAWSLPLLLMTWQFSADQPAGWMVAFYALALIFNYPHYMATIYRAYHNREDFARYRVYTLYVTALLAALLIAAHWFSSIVPWLFTAYITWSPWHYMGQNFGLMMMFIHRVGARIERKDRNALWAAFVASYVMIFLTFHANPSVDPLVLSLGLPPLLDILRIPMIFVFGALGMYPLWKLARRAGWRAMIAPITIYATEFLWFVLPTALELIYDFRVPQARYSAGILAVMHSAQYIWITTYYARQESASWRRPAYFLALIIGGIALFVPTPWLASYALGHDFTTSFLIVTAVVNIHHFILDGAVWKLREKRVASVLIEGTRSSVETARATISSRRHVKVAFAAVLLLLAGLDQARYYLASGPDLSLAATLNPWDAALQTRIARTLIESERYDDAYDHYRYMMKYVPPDAAALTNFGILALRKGRRDEARESFERALEINPGYQMAQLYLDFLCLQAGGTGCSR